LIVVVVSSSSSSILDAAQTTDVLKCASSRVGETDGAKGLVAAQRLLTQGTLTLSFQPHVGQEDMSTARRVLQFESSPDFINAFLFLDSLGRR
jgi:hypothetical protein